MRRADPVYAIGMADAAHSGSRAFRLPVLVPEIPVFPWLAREDLARHDLAGHDLARHDGAGWPALAVLDLARAPLQAPGLRALMQEMAARGVRIVGLDGIAPERLGEQAAQLPPILSLVLDPAGTAAPAPARPQPAAEPEPGPQSLVLEGNLRSGQAIRHMAGDVSVVGTVASGAEIVAAGSVHVYGALRGRASAGADGGPAQIFCQHLAAELLAINGIHLLADDMDPALLGAPVRAARAGAAIRLHRLG